MSSSPLAWIERRAAELLDGRASLRERDADEVAALAGALLTMVTSGSPQ